MPPPQTTLQIMDGFLTQPIVYAAFSNFSQRLPGVERALLLDIFGDLAIAISKPYVAALQDATKAQDTENLRNVVQAHESQLQHEAELHAVETRYKSDLELLGAELRELQASVDAADIDRQLEFEMFKAELHNALSSHDASIDHLHMGITVLRGEIDEFRSTIESSDSHGSAGIWGVPENDNNQSASSTADSEGQNEYAHLPIIAANHGSFGTFSWPVNPLWSLDRPTDSRGTTVVDGGGDNDDGGTYDVRNRFIFESGEDLHSDSEGDEYPSSPMSYDGQDYVNSTPDAAD